MQPILATARLILRPFEPADVPAIQRLAGEYDVARNTALVPHPYPDGAAAAWIATHADAFAADRGVYYAITLAATGELLGSIGLTLERAHRRAELGYWIGKPYWGHGYCSEAAAVVIDYGFRACQLNRICASHLARNPASGRVLQKIGMQYEGLLRQHFVKWNEPQDVSCYGMLRVDFESAR